MYIIYKIDLVILCVGNCLLAIGTYMSNKLLTSFVESNDISISSSVTSERNGAKSIGSRQQPVIATTFTSSCLSLTLYLEKTLS